MPDFATLVVAPHGCVDQHIRLTMQPARTGLADAFRVRDVVGKPTGAKSEGVKARRMVIVPEGERGRVQSWAQAVCFTRIPSALAE